MSEADSGPAIACILSFLDPSENQSRISRTPYPPVGGERCHRGAKIQSRHDLGSQRKLRSPN